MTEEFIPLYKDIGEGATVQTLDGKVWVYWREKWQPITDFPLLKSEDGKVRRHLR